MGRVWGVPLSNFWRQKLKIPPPPPPPFHPETIPKNTILIQKSKLNTVKMKMKCKVNEYKVTNKAKDY